MYACMCFTEWSGLKSKCGASSYAHRGGTAASAGGTRAAAGLGPHAASHPAGGSRPALALCSGVRRPAACASRAAAEQGGARHAFKLSTSVCKAAPVSRWLGKTKNVRAAKLVATRRFLCMECPAGRCPRACRELIPPAKGGAGLLAQGGLVACKVLVDADVHEGGKCPRTSRSGAAKPTQVSWQPQ
jgi:hypothetical protein